MGDAAVVEQIGVNRKTGRDQVSAFESDSLSTARSKKEDQQEGAAEVHRGQRGRATHSLNSSGS